MRTVEEVYVPYLTPSTYVRIVRGDNSDLIPLILLHGGPGSTHNYFESLDCIADTGRTVIMYDQIGCGKSYRDHSPELWKKETWDQELTAVIEYLGLDQYHLLGQSWGGMLALAYFIEHQPKACKSLILSSTLSSSALWSKEQHRMISALSQEEQDAITKAEQTGNYEDPSYVAANDHYMELHSSSKPKDDDPEYLRREKKSGKEAYVCAWGPNEYTPLGTLKDFDYTDRLSEIKIPALILHGSEDLCTDLIANTMADGIPNSKIVTFRGARHMCYIDAHDAYVDTLTAWLSDLD